MTLYHEACESNSVCTYKWVATHRSLDVDLIPWLQCYYCWTRCRHFTGTCTLTPCSTLSNPVLVQIKFSYHHSMELSVNREIVKAFSIGCESSSWRAVAEMQYRSVVNNSLKPFGVPTCPTINFFLRGYIELKFKAHSCITRPLIWDFNDACMFGTL